jgi:hypothetical protein
MQTTPLRALERFVHRVGGSPNSAVEAGSRLLLYVVDQVAEDTSHSSTVALPLQLFFPLISDFSLDFFAHKRRKLTRRSISWQKVYPTTSIVSALSP